MPAPGPVISCYWNRYAAVHPDKDCTMQRNKKSIAAWRDGETPVLLI